MDYLERVMRWLQSDHPLAVVADWSLKLALALLLLLIGWRIARRLADGLRRMLSRSGADPLLGDFLRNVVFVLLLSVVAVAVLDRLGVPTASLLAALGAAGLAIGLALQASLSNIAAGVLLMVFRPFRIGQSIEVAGVSGTVQNVSLMHTHLLTADNREVILPNSKVAGDAIVNASARTTRRIELLLDIGSQEDIGRAIEEIRTIVQADSRILESPAPEVLALGLTEGGLKLAVRPWVRSGDVGVVQSDLLLAIKQRFDAAGIRLPQRELVFRPADAAAQPALPQRP
ncbi:mechanosensitive ion channel family protein [Dokdonella koreensis]|uniref:Small-conductance mechanosensitive channel n=1 Tax=Dokdonella koreensis DS-123 TaxID=1300342 RepID=A0A160DTK5_9GAMM|nr:mechanosensitive ion channel domain-containing protein [Dokdonella koreensis]ANB17699.1 Small-conductance mechanosensitive channel [Dokdonella koreensis DS-123]